MAKIRKLIRLNGLKRRFQFLLGLQPVIKLVSGRKPALFGDEICKLGDLFVLRSGIPNACV